MTLLGGHIADDIDMNSFRLRIPDIKADGERGHISANTVRDGDMIGTPLLHGLRQLEKQPVVEFAGEGMVEIHRLRLTPDMLWTNCTKALVVAGTDAPKGRLLGTVGLQPLTEDKQGIVALGKRVAQIGTWTRTIIAIMHFTVTEMHHEVVFVDYSESEDLGGCYRSCRHQNSKQDDSLEKLLSHIVHLLIWFLLLLISLAKIRTFYEKAKHFAHFFIRSTTNQQKNAL